jgi:NADP-reducing hydrogenase subunit HndD
MEEAGEFINRVEKGGKLPLITSCSPGWVGYCERYYPEFIENLSSCKSPQQMFGAMVKTYYARKEGINPEDIFVVTIMPCTAKKYETLHRDNAVEGLRDIDVALTTRELGRMIERAGLMFDKLPDEQPDSAFGEATGAGVIFGCTGGVLEAALRTAAEKLSGQKLPGVDFNDVRGLEGVKEASYDIAGKKVNVAVASGTANAKKLLEMVKSGDKDYQFIEVMGCPGGCINGGGQPVHPITVRNNTDLSAARSKAIYELDKNNPLRKSHESPLMKKLYADFLGEPGSKKAHEILHTHHKKMEKYPGVNV